MDKIIYSSVVEVELLILSLSLSTLIQPIERSFHSQLSIKAPNEKTAQLENSTQKTGPLGKRVSRLKSIEKLYFDNWAPLDN